MERLKRLKLNSPLGYVNYGEWAERPMPLEQRRYGRCHICGSQLNGCASGQWKEVDGETVWAHTRCVQDAGRRK